MPDLDYSYLISQLHARLQQAHISRTSCRNELFISLYYEGPCTRKSLLSSVGSESYETLYRNLRLFLRLDIAQEVRPGLFELSDRFKQHRHYMWCRICNSRLGLYDEVLEKTLARAVKRHNFALEDHQLDITGICPKCLLNPKNKPKQAIGGRLRRYILNP